jgi:hypothetical protein
MQASRRFLMVVALLALQASALGHAAVSAPLAVGERTPIQDSTLIDAVRRAKLTAPDGADDDHLGVAVAIEGDSALVGAFWHDTPAGERAGSVYVFVRSGNVWTYQATLTASDASAFDQFGISAALDGDTAVIGADMDSNQGGTTAGSAYVFVRTGDTWIEQAHLFAPDGAGGDQFGFSSALHADSAIIGSVGGQAAYVFVRAGEVWSHQAILTAPDAGSDGFGWSVDVDLDTAVVGAPYEDNQVGSSHVFARSGETWIHQTQLIASDARPLDQFGRSVAVSGDTIAIGAMFHDTPRGLDAGSAYIFLRDGGVWTEQARLGAPDGGVDDEFGSAVGLDGNTLAVSAYRDDIGSETDAGSAYLFIRSGSLWAARSKLVAPDRDSF